MSWPTTDQIADRLGWLAYHTHDSRRSEPGFPDLVLVHPVKKQLLFRELKRTKGVVSAAQTKWLVTLRSAGHDAKIWRPADWLDGSIENELKGLTA